MEPGKDLFPDNPETSSTSHEVLGKDLEKLGKEIVEKKATAETKSLSDKDLIRQHLQPMVYPQGKPVPQPQAAEEDKYLPGYLKDAAPEIKHQVERLLEDTIRHGLEKGISEAQKTSPFVLDAYHDALIDKLHDELVKRKII